MPRTSAGLLMYRLRDGEAEVLLVHPGGPFWKNKDQGAWSIPKGEYGEGGDPLAVARREFQEETGTAIDGEFVELGEIRQKAGKLVRAWAVEGDLDAEAIVSNTFKVQWPPGSGRWITVPEVDRAGWFDLDEARARINPAQAAFLDRLRERLG